MLGVVPGSAAPTHLRSPARDERKHDVHRPVRGHEDRRRYVDRHRQTQRLADRHAGAGGGVFADTKTDAYT